MFSTSILTTPEKGNIFWKNLLPLFDFLSTNFALAAMTPSSCYSPSSVTVLQDCTTAVQRFTLKVWRWALAERLTELTCYTMKWKQIQQWLQRSNLQTRELIINSAVYRLSVLTCCFSAEYLSFFTKTSVPQWHHADTVSLLQTALEISQTFSWASSKCKIWLIY